MEVMALIKCKYIEHVTQKQMPRNGTMCKDKWNGINSDFKKLSDYHKGTEHHTLYWELSTDKCDNYHLLDPSIQNITMQLKHFKESASSTHHYM